MPFEYKQLGLPEKPSEAERLHGEVDKLLNSGVNLHQLAELLGAEDFLETRGSGRRKHGTVTSINVSEFVSWVVQSSSRQKHAVSFPVHMATLGDVILPPDKQEIRTGSGTGFEMAEYIPKTRYLIDLLSEMGLQYSVVDGTNTENMMRQLSYKAFLLPQIGKMVLVCDEGGNATFVVHAPSLEGAWKKFIQMKKSELYSLENEGTLESIFYHNDMGGWKDQIQQALGKTEKTETERKWYTQKKIAKMLGINPYKVEMYFSQLRGVRPESFENRYSGNRKLAEHADESILRYIEEHDGPQPPEGWITANAISKIVGKTGVWVKNRIDQHPHIAGRFRGRTYGSPEFVRVLKGESLEATGDVEEGWLTEREITLKTGVDQYYLWKQWSKLYLEAHRELTPVERLKPNGNVALHYPPELWREFQKSMDERKATVAPEGWKTLRHMSSDFNMVGGKSLVERINNLEGQFSDQVAKYYHPSRNRMNTFYGPLLIQEIEEQIRAEEQELKLWSTIEDIMSQEGLTFSQVAGRIFKLKKADVSLSDEILLHRGRHYFSPRMVQKILEAPTRDKK